MNQTQLSNSIHKIKDYIDTRNISADHVLLSIEKCNIPQWLKTVLLWVAAKTLRKMGMFSFLVAYLTVGSTLLITRPGLWIWFFTHIIGKDNAVGSFLIAVAEYIDGTVDYVVFWGLTAVAVLVVVCDCIVKLQDRRVRKELRTLIEAVTFSPTDSWFDDKCKIAISTLGSRYSESENFHNPRLSNIYKALIHPEYWDNNFKRAIQAFVKECKSQNNHLPQSVDEQREIVNSKIDNILSIYNERRLSEFLSLFQSASEILDVFRQLHYNDDDVVMTYDLNKIEDVFRKFEDYKEICQYTSYPVLYIKGEAGTGKSHLLADIVSNRMRIGIKSLLLLGLEFQEECDIRSRIMTILGAKGNWDDFLTKLDKIAELENHRILIIIDGVNEGAGAKLWANVIGGIETDILQHKHLGLVVSARTFTNNNILDSVSKGKASINLEGFRGIEDEAITYLTGKFGVTMPNISRYRKEFSNPLFLKLYCQAWAFFYRWL